MANTALKKITTRAKQIRKSSPGVSWKSAIKKAGADYRSGKLGAIKILETGEKKSVKPKKYYRVNRKANGTFKGYSIAGVSQSNQLKKDLKKKKLKMPHGYATEKRKRISGISIGEAKSVIKSNLDEKYKWMSLNLLHAKTKKAKREIRKKLAVVKSEMKKQGMLVC